MKKTRVTAEHFWEYEFPKFCGNGQKIACDRTYFGNSNSKKTQNFLRVTAALGGVIYYRYK